MIEIDAQLARVARGDIPEQHTHVLGISIAPSGRFPHHRDSGARVTFPNTGAGDAPQWWV
jgi:hypothetical protein